jgi:hypothetical protein
MRSALTFTHARDDRDLCTLGAVDKRPQAQRGGERRLAVASRDRDHRGPDAGRQHLPHDRPLPRPQPEPGSGALALGDVQPLHEPDRPRRPLAAETAEVEGRGRDIGPRSPRTVAALHHESQCAEGRTGVPKWVFPASPPATCRGHPSPCPVRLGASANEGVPGSNLAAVAKRRLKRGQEHRHQRVLTEGVAS